MKTVVLIRHGETEWNRQRRVQGWAPVPLTERGVVQARAVGDALNRRYEIDRVVASDLRRTVETVRHAASLASPDVTVRYDRGWRERNLGVLQGFGYDELDRKFPQYSLASVGAAAVEERPEGGESLLDVRDRVLEAWDRTVAGTSDDQTTLVVTHGGPLRLLFGALKELDVVTCFRELSPKNCAINEIRVDDGVEIFCENETVELAESDEL